MLLTVSPRPASSRGGREQGRRGAGERPARGSNRPGEGPSAGGDDRQVGRATAGAGGVCTRGLPVLAGGGHVWKVQRDTVQTEASARQPKDDFLATPTLGRKVQTKDADPRIVRGPLAPTGTSIEGPTRCGPLRKTDTRVEWAGGTW